MLDLEKITDLVELTGPALVRAVTLQDRFELCAFAGTDRSDLGDGASAADHGELLAPMFDGVEEIGEPAGRIGGAYLGHTDQIIRSPWPPA